MFIGNSKGMESCFSFSIFYEIPGTSNNNRDWYFLQQCDLCMIFQEDILYVIGSAHITTYLCGIAQSHMCVCYTFFFP